MTIEWSGEERRRVRWRPPLSAVGPYLAICLVVVVGFFVQGENTARVEREAKNRDQAICMDGNERAAALRRFTVRLGEEIPAIPADVAKSLAETAADEFAAKDCPPEP